MLESSNPPSAPRRRRLTRRSSRSRLHQPSPQQPTRHSPDASAVSQSSGTVGASPSANNLAIVRSNRAPLPPTRNRRGADRAHANANARFNLRNLLFGDASQSSLPKPESALRLPEVERRSTADLKRLRPDQRNRNVRAMVPAQSRQPASISRQRPQQNVHALVPRTRRTDDVISVSPTPVRSPNGAKSKLAVAPNHRVRKAQSRARRSPSALVYATRLLILGVGIGAIAGTFLSVWSPAVRSGSGTSASGGAASASAQTVSTSNQAVVPGTVSSSLALIKPGRALTDLSAQVRTMAAEIPELTPGVFLLDLDTGNYLDVNGTSTFAAASMIKVPVLVAFLQDVDAGKIRLDEMLTMREADIAEGSGDMQYQPAGTQFTALETASKMITVSDNTATNMLIHRMGGIEVMNQRFQQWGLQTTKIHNVLPDLQGTNVTTPKELSSLLAMVSQGNLLSLRSRDRLFEIMRQTVTNTLLPAGIGEDQGAVIAHKTGDIGSLVGDTGIVDMPNGKRFVVTIAMRRPFNDDRAQELIRQITHVSYQYINNPPAVNPSSASSSPTTTTESPMATDTQTASPSAVPSNAPSLD